MSVARALGLGEAEIQRLIAGRWNDWVHLAPDLRLVEDPEQLGEWMRTAPLATSDLILHSLAQLAAEDGADDRDAALLLCWLMLPAASILARDLRSLSDADALVASQLWIEARSFPWRTTARVAANIRHNLRKHLLRTELHRNATIVWARTQTLEPARLHERPAGPLIIPTADELQLVLHWGCARGAITEDDRLLLEAVVEAAITEPTAPATGALLFGEKVCNAVGRIWGISGRTVRRRTQRAIQALAELARRTNHPDVA